MLDAAQAVMVGRCAGLTGDGIDGSRWWSWGQGKFQFRGKVTT